MPNFRDDGLEFVATQKIDMPTTLRNRTCDFLEHRPWGGAATKRPASKDASEPAPAPFESPPTKPPPFRPSAELTYEGTASSIEEDPSTPGLWTSLASLYLRSSSPIVAAPAPDAPMEEGPSATPSMAEMADPRAWWSAMNCTGPRKAPARPNAAAADNAFDLMYRLRSEEEALGARPSEPAVRALMASFEATAGQLVALGEAEKARDISHVFLPALLFESAAFGVDVRARPRARAHTTRTRDARTKARARARAHSCGRRVPRANLPPLARAPIPLRWASS